MSYVLAELLLFFWFWFENLTKKRLDVELDDVPHDGQDCDYGEDENGEGCGLVPEHPRQLRPGGRVPVDARIFDAVALVRIQLRQDEPAAPERLSAARLVAVDQGMRAVAHACLAGVRVEPAAPVGPVEAVAHIGALSCVIGTGRGYTS